MLRSNRSILCIFQFMQIVIFLLFRLFFSIRAEMTIRGPLREDDTQVLKVERPFYQQQQFNSELSYCKPDTTHSADCSAWMTNIRPLKFISNIFPFFTWMSQYNIRNDLVCDIISGCTVAVMHIPQGKIFMAFECLLNGLQQWRQLTESDIISMICLLISCFQVWDMRC